MTIFKGSGVALVTPFNQDNEINFEKVRDLIEYHIENETDSIIICGTTGESSTLDDEEHRELIRFAVEVINKRIPLIAGTGSNDTRHGVSLSKYAYDIGADGLLCVTPYYNKANQDGLYQHFKLISEAVDIPIILYNVPSRTGMSFDVETVLKLSELGNIVGIKEASGDISYAAELVRRLPSDFALYSGNDDIIIPILSLGGLGVISVVANVLPRETHHLVKLYHAGKHKEALALQLKMNELTNALFADVNPIPVKTALNILGYEVGHLRLPLSEMKEGLKVDLENTINNYSIPRRSHD